MAFLHFWKKAMLLFKLFTTGIDWHLKKTRIETSKYWMWTVIQNWLAKLTSWGSSFNLLWNSVMFFKFNQHRPMTGVCALCNCPCSLKDPKNWRTGHAVVKLLVFFFLSILFENKEKPMKKGLFAVLVEGNGLLKPFGLGIL